ncbi:MAG TPA: FMN reductase [Candidatus Limnocylindrales bacterium]|nr:FMN reductase [Candidatus Limnocylindrales bacterium]
MTERRDPGERSIVVVTAGLSQPSSTRLLGDRLAAATERHLRDREIAPVVTTIELRDHARELVNHLLTGFAGPELRAVIDQLLGADGLIAVSPIFSASYSGLFKLFFDVVERDGLAGVPTLLAATGGTARHSLALEHALRPLFAYLSATTIPTAVFAAAEDWGRTGVTADRTLADRIDRAARELADTVALRPPRTRRDPFADPVPFEDLLRSTDPRGTDAS